MGENRENMSRQASSILKKSFGRKTEKKETKEGEENTTTLSDMKKVVLPLSIRKEDENNKKLISNVSFEERKHMIASAAIKRAKFHKDDPFDQEIVLPPTWNIPSLKEMCIKKIFQMVKKKYIINNKKIK